MKKLSTTLSPASFIAVYAPHKRTKRAQKNLILTELLIQGTPTGAYSMQMQGLRERFNGMYYKFLNKITLFMSYYDHLSPDQQEDVQSLFDELIEMRSLLEKEPISTR